MRLIDADLFLEFINAEMKQNRPDDLHIRNITRVLEDLPTAYDVDKVVEQLEETREKDIPRINNTTTKRDEKVYKLAMSYAIDIVKAGGIDE